MVKKRKKSENVDQDAEEPKRIRRPSAAISKSGLTPSQIRSTTLQLNLDKYPLTDTVVQEIERLSILGGRWRHLVGLFSNFLACRRLSLTNIEDLPSGLHTFYNRSWAALEAVKNGKNHDLLDEAQAFLDHSLHAALPDSIPVDLRKPITRDMATATKRSFVENFFPRVKAHIKWELGATVHGFTALGKDIQGQRVRALVSAVQQFSLEGLPPCDVAVIQPLLSLMTDARAQIQASLGELQTKRQEKYIKELQRVQTGQRKTTPKLPAFPSRTDAFYNVLTKRLPLFFPIMSYISNRNETRMDDYNRLMEESGRRSKRPDFPAPFCLLPMWQLQPAFMEYAKTQIKTAFRVDDDPELFLQKHLATESLPNRVRRRLSKFTVNTFYSNGVEIHINLIANKEACPAFSNSDDLFGAGYKFSNHGPVHPSHGPCGVYTIQENLVDCEVVPNISPDFTITVVDPGCADVITVRTTAYKDADGPLQILNNSSTWSVGNATYGKESGFLISQQRDSKRRQRKDHKYESVVSALSRTRRNTVNMSPYLHVLGTQYRALCVENMTRSRRKTRWLMSTLRKRTIDLMANRLCKSSENGILAFGDGSFKPQKGHAPVPSKKIVRAVAAQRTIFMLGEWGTSMRCPGGCGGEMKDVAGEYRIRRCETEVGTNHHRNCSLSHNGHAFRSGRDDSSTINMVACIKKSLDGEAWPIHLQKPY